MMIRIVLKNIFYYWRKTLITVILTGAVLSLGVSSIIFTSYIKGLVDKPLESIQTEIILQKDTADKNPQDIKTTGVILPFNLESFPKSQVTQKVSSVPNIKSVSTALVLWQFDVKNNRTLVALDINEPKVGLRNIEMFLMPGSSFFSSNDASEIILERHFATLLKYKVGGDYPVGPNNYKIIGLVDFQEQSNLANAQGFLPYQTALTLIGEKDLIVNQAFISLKSASDLSQVKDELMKVYPSYSIISKDNLLKNLTGLNQMFYRFGNYFSYVMVGISLLLTLAVLHLHRIEYAYQSELLKTLGWPKNKIRQWIVIDSATILISALVLTILLSLLLKWQLPVLIKIAPMINYNIKL